MKNSLTQAGRSLFLVILLLTGFVASAGRADSPVAAQDSEVDVQIIDFAYEPATLEVAAGTTVVWTNAGSAPHTVTSDADDFDSGRLDPGDTFSMTFDAPGTYNYFCSFHPNMQATIVVTGETEQGGTGETPESEVTPTVPGDSEETGDETSGPGVDHPEHVAHIHAGTCDELGIVVYSLAGVQTTVHPPRDDGTEIVEMIAGTANVTLDDLFNEPFSVHIHESEQHKAKYVGCAEIGERPEEPWSPDDGLALDLAEQAESGHQGTASLRSDTGGATTVTLLMFIEAGGDSEPETDSPPPSTTYTSPTYGYFFGYGAAWTVSQETATNGVDQLVLTNGTSFVTVTGTEAFGGDPDTCVEGIVEERLADPAVSNIVLATDDRGEPIQGGTEATGAFAIYDHDYTFPNGGTEPWTLFVQCIPLDSGNANIAFVQNVPTVSFADEAGARQALLRGLTLPQ